MSFAESQIETVTVTGTAIEETTSDQTETLGNAASNETLGGFLDAMPNVDSASYGEAVGRPVVRGMSGYRLKILHNHNEVSDLSAMSQDHAVAVAPRASERIELLKGPASLLYAAHAGGVIKISDVLEAPFPQPGVNGDISADFRGPTSSHNLDAQLTFAKKCWLLHFTGLRQAANAYEAGEGKTIPDSDVDTSQGQIALGWKPGGNSEWQLNANWLNKDYGIPNETPAATRIDMERENIGAKFRHRPVQDWLDEITLDVLASDYLHDETEGGRKDGLFGQKQLYSSLNLAWTAGEWWGETRASIARSELKVCHEHGACDGFRDAVRTGSPPGELLTQYFQTTGLSYSHGHPMPDTERALLQVSTVAQRTLDEMHEISVGVNLQSRRLAPSADNIQEQWVYPAELDADYYAKQNDQTYSLSLGLTGEFVDQPLRWEASLSYLQRFASVDELYWNGFHHATDTYVFGNPDLEKERSLNLDVDLTWDWSNHLVQLSGFYYDFNDYIYQHQGYADDGTALSDPFHLSPVWLTRQADARFSGGSLRYENTINTGPQKSLTFWLQADVLDAKKNDGEYLPRTAPMSAHTGLKYKAGNWMGTLALTRIFHE